MFKDIAGFLVGIADLGLGALQVWPETRDWVQDHWYFLAIMALLSAWLLWRTVKRRRSVPMDKSGGTGAFRGPDGSIRAGDGGNGRFGGGGGGGGGLSIDPDGRVQAGGGGGGGGLGQQGGQGGGPLGGGGGGASGIPPEFWNSGAGKALMLITDLRETYGREKGHPVPQGLPIDWANKKLREWGYPNARYSTEGGGEGLSGLD